MDLLAVDQFLLVKVNWVGAHSRHSEAATGVFLDKQLIFTQNYLATETINGEISEVNLQLSWAQIPSRESVFRTCQFHHLG